MIFDFNEAWSRIEATSYDVCICGTGPAGISLARKLAGKKRRVLLLEGGGLSYSAQSQEFYKGRNVGRRYYALEAGRLRFFGGTSNHWSGRCGLFDPIDFEAREYFGLPGWPVARDQLLRNLGEACEILDISGSDLIPAAQADFGSPSFVRSGYALSPPTRFSEKYEVELRRSEEIDLFYHANLIDLLLNGDRTGVLRLVANSYGGQKVEVTAENYVLALGAIENARTLLNADSQVPGGIGNHAGLVGRCFMEHLNVPVGRFLVTDPRFWRAGDFPAVPTEALLRHSGIGNGILSFDPSANPQSSGRLRVIKQFLRETGCALPALTKVARSVIDFDCPGDGIVTSLIEQSPNLRSRISLTDERDPFGLRRVQLDWQLHERDFKTIRVLAIEAAKEMARLDRARVQLAPFILDTDREIEVEGHAHHMGTTRMSSDIRQGVVDSDCRVHGINNLFVAGSSVFPTGGGTNPTLTIVLLALRLAEHLTRNA